ncbi:cytokine-like nuclear factor N-PAC isoform X6 [Lethenteron reissneri]|uniref:cytokine-like nuclear factor N-PAC isoform X6 n=1 Tax=Lethenteron reissneri TaxID=7753 RepID=UPI002AB77CED|nr:cytokine-like nuclear factor N-PAC isoform X6 [Lethenteron reissneri]
MAAHFKIGELVWGKMGKYPPWPGKIVKPPKDMKKPKGKPCYFVKFFGTEDHAWIKVDQLKPFQPHKEDMVKANKSKRFLQALDSVEEFINKKKVPEVLTTTAIGPAAIIKRTPSGSASSFHAAPPPSTLQAACAVSALQAVQSPSSLQVVGSPSLTEAPATEVGVSLLQCAGDASNPQPPPLNGGSSETSSESPQLGGSAVEFAVKSEHLTTASETGATNHVTLGMPLASVQAADTTAANGNITPIDKRIGFLGLGLMGCGMVQNLLKTGHNVTVWSRTASKCDIFVQDGAYLGRTPAEVVSSCDITLACIADPAAAKELVLGPSGVLQGIRPGKCYVDMSTVDPETAVDISEAVTLRGGRYLEAPVSGNKRLSEDGGLLVLAAGDRALYDECNSCFQAICRRAFYLGEVGSAARMALVVNMILGSFMTSLAEGFSLAQRCGLSQQTLLDVLSLGPIGSSLVEQKGLGILQGDYEPNSSLKHVQKDLRLALAMGDMLHQQTPVAAAANEMFKKAKSLDQSENDMSAVYRVYE